MATAEHPDGDDLDRAPAARGALYGLFAACFDEPDAALHAALSDGRFDAEVRSLVEATALAVEVPSIGTDDDHDTLRARYNDLFELGQAEYENRADGSLNAEGPPVPLYETRYREDASWQDVNLDLARAYDYYGLEVDEERREHHDHLRLMLEFAGYLARREATGEADAARARLDFLDRHLGTTVAGVAERLHEEPDPGAFEPLADCLEALVRADRAALVERFDDGGVS